MQRRELLKMIALVTGGAVIGGEFLLTGCSPVSNNKEFKLTQDQINWLNEVAETILPKTNTPGAKDAKVGEFISTQVRDCYSVEDQQVFLKGMDQLEATCKEITGKPFLDCTAEEKTQVLIKIDTERKQLTLFGFFTSEPGATQALRYVAVPGRYDGCVDYTPGDRAWAS
jgi:hypothetical protein